MDFVIKKNAPCHKLHKHWQFCVGSGHASLALRTDYARQLKFIHDELGIERVRFHGIFNDDMNTKSNLSVVFPIPGAEAYKELNFHSCGIAYDNVLAAGMKPFVELGFMPKDLAGGDDQCVFFYKGNISMPADMDVWRQYIIDFIHYLQHRYGEEEVRTWYFEVWNEPDLIAFFHNTQQDYFKLYEATARAVKEADPLIRVGGPATSGSKWVAAFVRYCQENDVPVDFVSTHQYAGDPLGGITDTENDIEAEGKAVKEPTGGMTAEEMRELERQMGERLSAAPEKTFLSGYRQMRQDKSELEDIPNNGFRVNSAIVKKQAAGLPVFYTEWNENAIFSAYTNDTRKVAAYDIKAALDVENNLDGSSIWCFSDIFEEFHMFPQEFHGGFGMLTINGIPKPGFYAMKMLAQAGEKRIDLGRDATDGEIGIAAFESETEKQVLLFRLKMKNLDLPKETAKVTVEMEQAPRKVILQRIDEDHCNPLKIWEEMGKPEGLNVGEVTQIKEKSCMNEEEITFEFKDGNVYFKAELAVNDVYFIRIVKG